MSSRHEGGQEVVMAVAAPHQMGQVCASMEYSIDCLQLFTEFRYACPWDMKL